MTLRIAVMICVSVTSSIGFKSAFTKRAFSLQLRAASSVVRLWLHQGKRTEARERGMSLTWVNVVYSGWS